jgi:hypothetical protein
MSKVMGTVLGLVVVGTLAVTQASAYQGSQSRMQQQQAMYNQARMRSMVQAEQQKQTQYRMQQQGMMQSQQQMQARARAAAMQNRYGGAGGGQGLVDRKQDGSCTTAAAPTRLQVRDQKQDGSCQN